MAWLAKTIAIVIIIGLLLTIFRPLLYWAIGAIIVIILIRLLADFFWWGRDRGNW